MSATGHAAPPKFRDNLVAQPVEDSGIQYVDVSDPYSGASFRFYDFEYAVAYLMDGTRSPEDVARSARSELGFETTPEDVSAFAEQLTKLGYVTAAARAAEFDEHEAPTATTNLADVAVKSLSVEEGAGARKVAPDETSFEGLIDDRKPKAAEPIKVAPPPVVPVAPVVEEKIEELSSPELVIESDEPSVKKPMLAELAPIVAPPIPETPTLPPSRPTLSMEGLRPPDPPPAFAKPQLTLPNQMAPKHADPVERVQLPAKSAKPPARPVPAAEPVEAKKSNALLYILLLLLLGAGGAVFYLKFLKKDAEPAKPPAPVGHKVTPPGPGTGTPPGPGTGTPPGPGTGTPPGPGTATPASDTMYAEQGEISGSAGGAAPAQVSFTTAGKVNWLVKDGTQVNAGDVVAKQAGIAATEAKVKDREGSLAGHQKKLDEAKAKQPPNAAKIASEQKDVDRVAAELKGAQDKLDGMVAKAATAGTTKALLQVGDDVEPGKPVVEVAGGGPSFGATFALKTTDSFAPGGECKLDAAGTTLPCSIVSAEAKDGITTVVVKVSNDVTAMPAVGTKVKLMKAGK